jgi:hypothetical protein
MIIINIRKEVREDAIWRQNRTSGLWAEDRKRSRILFRFWNARFYESCAWRSRNWLRPRQGNGLAGVRRRPWMAELVSCNWIASLGKSRVRVWILQVISLRNRISNR